ncbi:MAG: YgiT-type zinc finger protein [Anaerolineae bacterium]|nr:YgiT-type zinc finger protein [Anaerolineae bacterium]
MSNQTNQPPESNTCPYCHLGHLHPTQHTYVHAYEDSLVHMPNIPAWQCDVCRVVLYDECAIRQLEVLIGESGPPPNRYVPQTAPSQHEDQPYPRPEQ